MSLWQVGAQKFCLLTSTVIWTVRGFNLSYKYTTPGNYHPIVWHCIFNNLVKQYDDVENIIEIFPIYEFLSYKILQIMPDIFTIFRNKSQTDERKRILRTVQWAISNWLSDAGLIGRRSNGDAWKWRVVQNTN